MSIRENPTYLTMTPIRMVQIIEEEEDPTEEEFLAAWQWVWDTGIWRQLQGSYGRMVHLMLQTGQIEE